ncbi:hypothetical protein PWT90_08948 [Aphanocladium album]|nr:hypothetical protein PWT90_08948 [Aphanocladium album]
MDGLLINSEDKLTDTMNEILSRYNRPPLTAEMRCRMMGVPGSSNSDQFHEWARLPIPREQYAAESHKLMYKKYTESKPLPGAIELLTKLSGAHCPPQKGSVELAIASTSSVESFELKITQPETRRLLEMFAKNRRILGNDPKLPNHRKKPAPDVYSIALSVINMTRPEGVALIQPNECLAFEDSAAGVEAARRAGMRVVWVPHPMVLAESDEERQQQVLAGQSGQFELGDNHQLGEVGDGWGECIGSLSEFDPTEYGIEL